MKNIFDQLAEKSAQESAAQTAEETAAQTVAQSSARHDSGPSSDSKIFDELDRIENAPIANDSRQTPAELKLAIQELLRHGYLEEQEDQTLFRKICLQAEAINSALEPLDLALKTDTHRGVAFLIVAKSSADAGSGTRSDDEGWNHPLVRRQRFTLEQSLLVAILRQSFAMHEQEYGVGQSVAKVTIDELLPNFLTYFGDSGSDSKNENRLLQLMDQLKSYGIVSEVDQKQEVTIGPLIAHLANPESLSALLGMLLEKNGGKKNDHSVDGDTESSATVVNRSGSRTRAARSKEDDDA